MNTNTEEFVFSSSDSDELVEPKERQVVPTRAPVANLHAKPLSGYENIMRRHAAACEAGR